MLLFSVSSVSVRSLPRLYLLVTGFCPFVWPSLNILFGTVRLFYKPLARPTGLDYHPSFVFWPAVCIDVPFWTFSWSPLTFSQLALRFSARVLCLFFRGLLHTVGPFKLFYRLDDAVIRWLCSTTEDAITLTCYVAISHWLDSILPSWTDEMMIQMIMLTVVYIWYLENKLRWFMQKMILPGWRTRCGTASASFTTVSGVAAATATCLIPRLRGLLLLLPATCPFNACLSMPHWTATSTALMGLILPTTFVLFYHHTGAWHYRLVPYYVLFSAGFPRLCWRITVPATSHSLSKPNMYSIPLFIPFCISVNHLFRYIPATCHSSFHCISSGSATDSTTTIGFWRY